MAVRLRAGLCLLAVGMLFCVGVRPAAACSGSRIIDGNEADYATRVVFTGTAVRSDDEFIGPVISTADPIYWTFAVDSVSRGQAGERFTVTSPRGSASCAAGFELGKRYRVVAWGGDPSRPKVLQGDATLLPPLADPPRIEGAFPPMRITLPIAVGGVLVAGALLGLLAIRLAAARTARSPGSGRPSPGS
jgi:hypothetical protein